MTPITQPPTEDGMYLIRCSDGTPLPFPYYRFHEGSWRHPSIGKDDQEIYSPIPESSWWHLQTCTWERV